MKMLLIFITLGFYFNAWGKKKKNKAKSANYWPSTVLFVQKLRKQTNKKKTLALQITANSGVLVTDIFYSYT